MKSLFLISFLTLLLVGCSTAPLTKFSEIRIGTDKTDVLDSIGSPIKSERIRGQDVWTYRFFDQSEKEIYKEVRFKKGFVSYVGNVKKRRQRGSSKLASPPPTREELKKELLLEKKEPAHKFVPVEN